jgi:hypothetical protein
MSRTIIVATAEWLARASSGSLPGEVRSASRKAIHKRTQKFKKTSKEPSGEDPNKRILMNVRNDKGPKLRHKLLVLLLLCVAPAYHQTTKEIPKRRFVLRFCHLGMSFPVGGVVTFWVSPELPATMWPPGAWFVARLAMHPRSSLQQCSLPFQRDLRLFNNRTGGRRSVLTGFPHLVQASCVYFGGVRNSNRRSSKKLRI